MKYRRKKPNLATIAIVGIALLIATIVPIVVYGTKDQITATVTKTERVTIKSGDGIASKYMVFTDKETMQNTDSLLYLKFNSSDLHGR